MPESPARWRRGRPGVAGRSIVRGSSRTTRIVGRGSDSGLGHETPSALSWLNGGNPTKGFLSGSVGPFSGIYHDIAGAGLVNVLFMVGLLGIGVALLLGIAMRPACIAGAAMVVLMWSASLPPQNDLFLDSHLIYAMLLIGLAAVGAGKTLGFGRRWAELTIVQRYPWLA